MYIDFVELGTYCQTEYRKSLDSQKEEYRKTLFVAIKDDNNISISTTPHILSYASKCILIHECSSLAVTNWYTWYLVQFINEKGEVLVNRIDQEFKLLIAACGGYANQRLGLSADGIEYLSYPVPWEASWEKCIKTMWNLYVRLKQAKTKSERELISALFRKDQKILELEKANQDFEYKTHLLESEKEMYKGILDDIKNILEKN